MARTDRDVRPLPRLRDRIRPGVRVLFVGINPGVRSALTGHHFAGFSNRFWKLLFHSGLVPEPLTCVDDDRLPEWGYGITNVVSRPTPGIDTLTREEYEQVKLHAVIGGDMLDSIDFPGPLALIVRHHHENWDGTGYPDGLSGDHIPLGARLLAIVDCYDALTSERPYRKGLPHDRALKMIVERRSTSFDPRVCDAFLRIVQGLRATAAPPPQDVVPPYAFRLSVPRLV